MGLSLMKSDLPEKANPESAFHLYKPPAWRARGRGGTTNLEVGMSSVLVREHNYERQCSLIKTEDKIIVICLIISTLTGEFILPLSSDRGGSGP